MRPNKVKIKDSSKPERFCAKHGTLLSFSQKPSGYVDNYNSFTGEPLSVWKGSCSSESKSFFSPGCPIVEIPINYEVLPDNTNWGTAW